MQSHQLEARKNAFKIYNKYFELMKRAAEGKAPDDVTSMIAMEQMKLAEAKLQGMTVEEYLKIARNMPIAIPKEYLIPPFPANISMTDFKNLLDVYDLQQYESIDVFRIILNFLAQEEDDDLFIECCEIARAHALFPEDDPQNFHTRLKLLRDTRAEAVDWVQKANATWKIYGRLPTMSLDERLKFIKTSREELLKLPIKSRGLEIVDTYTRMRDRNKDLRQAKSGVKMFLNHYMHSLEAIKVLHDRSQELYDLACALRFKGEDLAQSLHIAFVAKKFRHIKLVLLYHDKSKVIKALQNSSFFGLNELRMIRKTFEDKYISEMIDKLPVVKEAAKRDSNFMTMFSGRRAVAAGNEKMTSEPVLTTAAATQPVVAEVKEKDKSKKKKNKEKHASEPVLTTVAAKPVAAEVKEKDKTKKKKDKEKRASEPTLFAAKSVVAEVKEKDKYKKKKSKERSASTSTLTMYAAKPAKEKPKKHKEEVKAKDKSKEQSKKTTPKKKH